MNRVDFQQCLSVVMQAVQEAAVAILPLYQSSGLQIEMKLDQSLVTEADHLSNRIICECLSAAFPFPILSEENADDLSRLDAEYVWVIDPLDGTKEFIHQNDEFTINVALVKAGRPVLGVVAIPALGLIYHAVRGAGAFLIEKGCSRQIHVSSVSDLSNMRLAVSRSHFSADLKAVLERHHLNQFVQKGSALKYCSIADGSCDASLRKTLLSEWDICAADCVLTEAGGRITDCAGQPLQYNRENVVLDRGIVASNGVLHEALLVLVKSE